MIRFNATGKVLSIGQTESIATKSGTPFTKRLLVIDDSFTTRDGRTVAKQLAVEFTQERCPLLDALQPGMYVTVEGSLESRLFNGKYYHDVRGMTVAQSQPQQPGVQPAFAPAPQPMAPAPGTNLPF